jgi:hypothetical protein
MRCSSLPDKKTEIFIENIHHKFKIGVAGREGKLIGNAL